MMEDAVARNAPPDLRDLNEPSVWSVEMEQESESTDTFSSIFIPPSARRHWQPNESTPLRKDGKHNASEGASGYTFGVGDELAALTIEHWWRRRLTWVIFFFFFASVLFLVPIFIAVEEKWTYSASFYYSVQALLGIGFGDLNVDGDALKWLMIFELIGGSFFVVFLASYFLANYLSLADEEAVETAVKGHALKGSRLRITTTGGEAWPTAWKSLAKGFLLLVLINIIGVVYGIWYEKWNFVTSLFFIISAAQSSGLVEPGITGTSESWPAVFVALLCIAAVPTWAFCVAKAASILAEREQSTRRLLSAVDRQRKAEEAYLRRLAQRAEGEAQARAVDHAGFLELWLLRNGLVTEQALSTIRSEFKQLQQVTAPGSAPRDPTKPPMVDLATVSLRLRFLQLCALGLVAPDSWNVSLAKALRAQQAQMDEKQEKH